MNKLMKLGFTSLLAAPVLAGCGDMRTRDGASDGYLKGSVGVTKAQGSALTLEYGDFAGSSTNGASNGGVIHKLPMFFLAQYGDSCKGSFSNDPSLNVQSAISLTGNAATENELNPTNASTSVANLRGRPMKGARVVVSVDKLGNTFLAQNATTQWYGYNSGGQFVGASIGIPWATTTIPVPIQKDEDPSCTLNIQQVAAIVKNTVNVPEYRFYAAQSAGLTLRTGGVASMKEPARFTELDHSTGVPMNTNQTSLAMNGFVREDNFNNATGKYSVSLFYADTTNLVSAATLAAAVGTIINVPPQTIYSNYPTIGFGVNQILPPNYVYDSVAAPDGIQLTFDFLTHGVTDVKGLAFALNTTDPVTAQDVFINSGDRVNIPTITNDTPYEDVRDYVATIDKAGARVNLSSGLVVDLRTKHNLSGALLNALKNYNGYDNSNGKFHIVWRKTDVASGIQTYQIMMGTIA